MLEQPFRRTNEKTAMKEENIMRQRGSRDLNVGHGTKMVSYFKGLIENLEKKGLIVPKPHISAVNRKFQ